LFGREARVARLSNGGAKGIQTADVLVLRCDSAERFVESFRISTCELRDAAHAEDFEIAKHRRAYRDQVREFSRVRGHKNLLDSVKART
jgi:hypothetical protein